jgi:dTDP-4-amino-4,6-dideoxygalactose transaminase
MNEKQRKQALNESPVSDEVGDRLFCPPTHPYTSDEDNEYICAAIWEAVGQVAA